MQYLDFAIQFTPQYGDSFLEVIKVCEIMKRTHPHKKEHIEMTLEKVKQNCLHAEPNYGILWFYYKQSLIDNAYDVWQFAEQKIQKELSQPRDYTEINWLASSSLSRIIHNSTKIGSSKNCCTFEDKVKIVYGFEQILP